MLTNKQTGKRCRCSPVVIGYHIAVGMLVVELAPLQTRADPPRPPRIGTAENKYDNRGVLIYIALLVSVMTYGTNK